MNEMALIMMSVGLLVFVAHAFTEVFRKVRVPDLLLLMIIGLCLGPVFHVIDTDEMQKFSSFFTTFTLVIILFEGGSELTVENIRSCLKEMTTLTLTSFVLTMLGVGLVMHFVLGFKLMLSFFVGAALGSSSTAITIPLTKQLDLADRSRATLVLEASFATVVSFIISLAIFGAFTEGMSNAGQGNGFPFWQTVGRIVSSFTLSAVISFATALLWSVSLAKVRNIKNSTFTTPALVFIVYGINRLLGFSGEIAALTFGITLANIDYIYKSHTFNRLFKRQPETLNSNEKMLFSEVAFLLRTFVFVLIGASIKISDLESIVIGLCITALLLILRLISVKISIIRKNEMIPELDAIHISTQIPKGIAAAMLATILITKPISGAEEIKNIVFSVILFSIVFTCISIPIVEKIKPMRKLFGFLLYLGVKKDNMDSTEKEMWESTDESQDVSD